jgi:hypothetical protein
LPELCCNNIINKKWWIIPFTLKNVHTLAKGLSSARKEVKRNLFAWIYQQSQAGVPLSHILVRLKVV